MKMTPENLTPSPDLNGLCAAELLAVIAGFQQQLALKDEALQSKEEAIQRRDAHILLLEELLPEVQRLKALGYSNRDIAEDLGIGSASVSRYLSKISQE